VGIKQPHPEGDRDLPVTHVYRHPASKGLGTHHIGDDEKPLAERLAHPGSPPDWARSGLTMHDLDLQHGTELSLVDTDEERDGLLIFAWTDAQGDYRHTSMTPDQADEFLEPPDAVLPEAAPPDAAPEAAPADPPATTTDAPAPSAEGTVLLWRL